MDDPLLLIHGLMKIALLIGIMVLVATAPSGALAAGHGLQGSLLAGVVGTSAGQLDDSGSRSYAFDDDPFAGRSALEQTSLIAGTRDHEADYGRHDGEYESHGSSLMETDPFDHSFNTDGTPMCGDFDIHGNAYGVTDCHFDDSWGGGMSSMFD